VAAPDVAFHTGIADKLGYACRLLRKAQRQGATVVVTGGPAELQRLDQALWTFEPQEFVPHRLLRAGERVESRLQRTPIWLTQRAADVPSVAGVLVNLGPEPSEDDSRFARVIELVSREPEDVVAGRRRWKRHEAQGRPITHHPQNG
jgi:DNA polymerase-3 subunit chi